MGRCVPVARVLPAGHVERRPERSGDRRVPVARVLRRPERSGDRTREQVPSPSHKKKQKKKRELGRRTSSGRPLCADRSGAETEPASGAACQWHALSADRSEAETPSPSHKKTQKKKRETGIEPATPTLARWCSTAEPLAHCRLTTKRIIHYPCVYVNKNLK